ncbi:hypothetical protein DDN60_12535 [Vibrio cholerae]|nr:hypothetical protein [Vibrio cholerae]
MSMQSVRDGRGMPFLKRGMRVQSISTGKYGTVTSTNSAMNLNIRIDGEKHSGNYHPKWMLRYFDSHGALIAEYLN